MAVEIGWPQFNREWRHRFRQGEHVTVIGPTGCGKTFLSRELVKARNHVVAIGIKHRDDTLNDLTKQGWTKVSTWKRRPPSARQVILWPRDDDIYRRMDTQRKVFGDLLQDAFRVGGWCIWSDELRYMTDIIGLKKPYIQLYVTGRSNNISLVSAAQRPAHVPLEAYSQAQHLFLFRTGDERDLARMGGLNGTSAKQVANTVADLPHHHFLYVNLTNGEQIVTTVKKG